MRIISCAPGWRQIGRRVNPVSPQNVHRMKPTVKFIEINGTTIDANERDVQ